MKKTLLISLSIAFCIVAKAQTNSVQFAQNILNSIESGNIENLKKMMPTIEMYRSMSKTPDKYTDEEILKKTVEGEKLKSDFEKLQKYAKEIKVDWKAMQFDSIVADNIGLQTEAPWPIEIHFSVNGKHAVLPIIVVKSKGQWYFMDILMTTTVFKEF